MEEASVIRESSVTSVAKTPVEKDIDECPITNVVVYRDRAEVTRQVFLSALEVGELQVSILSLTQQANTDSIRVKTLESNCDILEVSHEAVYNQHLSSSTSTTVSEVKVKVEELEEKLAKIDNALTRLSSQRGFLTAYTNNFVSNAGAQVATRVGIKEAADVLVYYQNEVEKIDDERVKTEKEKKTVAAELEIQRRKLQELTNDRLVRGSEMRITLFISLETKAVEDIRLQFTYVVSNATWSPSYDIRVNNTDSTLALSYFAEVTQTTGENWQDCHLMLSTSNPSIGSTPPALPQKTFDFYRPYYGGYAKNEMLRSSVTASRAADFEDRHSVDALIDDDFDGGAAALVRLQQSQIPSDFRKAGVVGSGDAGSTVFTINRKVSIDCDNKPHKVMITARSFRPQMVHYAVPSVSPHVYIQAKTKNSSPYPLLASDNVSIYLDGNFISKSSLKQTSAGESFQIFVGVDPAVKVEYLPVRKEEYRKGWVSGSEVKKFSHATILHNTKSSAIRIILAESLPRSANEKITIDLLEPAANTLTEGRGSALPETTAQDAISNLTNYSENEDPNDDSLPRDFVKKNKLTNNVVWLKTLQPQEKAKVDFVYKVTWPKGSQISESNY
eukprot:gene5665-6089_t